jgi:hypothetical protein
VDDDSAGWATAAASWTSLARPSVAVNDPSGTIAIMEVVIEFTAPTGRATNGVAGFGAAMSVPDVGKSDGFDFEVTGPASAPFTVPGRMSVTTGGSFDFTGGFIGELLEVEIVLHAYAFGGRSGGESQTTVELIDRSLPGATASLSSSLSQAGALAADLAGAGAPAAPMGLSFYFYDASGNYVPGIRMISDTGVDYPVNGVVVPEPAAGVGCGILALACLARRARRT